jgi:hypothetical protein
VPFISPYCCLIGLQSGFGLHPDRTCQLPKFPIAKNRRNWIEFLFHPNRYDKSFSTVNFGIYQFWQSRLALPLFMLRILADHTHHALAVHDLALVANLFY